MDGDESDEAGEELVIVTASESRVSSNNNNYGAAESASKEGGGGIVEANSTQPPGDGKPPGDGGKPPGDGGKPPGDGGKPLGDGGDYTVAGDHVANRAWYREKERTKGNRDEIDDEESESDDSHLREATENYVQGGPPGSTPLAPPEGESYTKTGYPATDMDFVDPARKDFERMGPGYPFPAVTVMLLVFIVYLEILNRSSRFLSAAELQGYWPGTYKAYEKANHRTLTIFPHIPGARVGGPKVMRQFGSIIGQTRMFWMFICDSDLHFGVCTVFFICFAAWAEQHRGAFHLSLILLCFYLVIFSQRDTHTQMLGLECLVAPLGFCLCFMKFINDLDKYTDRGTKGSMSKEERLQLAVGGHLHYTPHFQIVAGGELAIPQAASDVGVTHQLLHDIGLPTDVKMLKIEHKSRAYRIDQHRVKFRIDPRNITRRDKFLKKHRCPYLWFFTVLVIFPILTVVAMELVRRQSPALGYSVKVSLEKTVFSLVAAVSAMVMIIIMTKCFGITEALGTYSRKKRHGYYIYRYIMGPEAQTLAEKADGEESDVDDRLLPKIEKVEVTEIAGKWDEKPRWDRFNLNNFVVFLTFLFTTVGAIYCTVIGREAIFSRWRSFPKAIAVSKGGR